MGDDLSGEGGGCGGNEAGGSGAVDCSRDAVGDEVGVVVVGRERLRW